MATIFVAYGDEAGRDEVLAFAAERAAASDDDLHVYHVAETVDEPATPVREAIEAVVERVAPSVEYTVEIEQREAESDATNVSNQKRLVDAIAAAGDDVAYVVMGNLAHSAVESFVVPSMTEAVLKGRTVPVVLVPADDGG